MRRKLHGRLGGLLLLLVVILGCGCTPSGSTYHEPSVYIVPDSRNVVIIDPNSPFIARRKSAVLDIGYYMELADLEAAVASGKLKRVEP